MNLSKTSIRIKAATLAVIAAAFAFAPASAQKNEYSFHHQVTPSQLRPYSAALFMAEGQNVANLTGHKLCESGKSIKQLAVSPAGIDYVILVANPKGNEAWVYST